MGYPMCEPGCTYENPWVCSTEEECTAITGLAWHPGFFFCDLTENVVLEPCTEDARWNCFTETDCAGACLDHRDSECMIRLALTRTDLRSPRSSHPFPCELIRLVCPQVLVEFFLWMFTMAWPTRLARGRVPSRSPGCGKG